MNCIYAELLPQIVFLQMSWMGRVTHLNKACDTFECVIRVISYIWMRLVAHFDASCHIFECVMSHMWMRRVTYLNASCHTCECVVSHIWTRLAAHMNEACHTFECVMSRIWMRHVTHVNTSCHTYEYVMSRVWIVHVAHVNEQRQKRLVRVHNKSCSLTHVWMSYVPHLEESYHTFERVMSHTSTSHVPYVEWLRLVGSLKLQVSFAKEPYKRDYILQKRPINLRSLLIVATPY